MEEATQGVDYFGRGHRLLQLQQRVSLRARRGMFDRWTSYCDAHGLPHGRVLDVGGTPDTSLKDSNCMIRWFLDTGATVAMTSPEDLTGLVEQFPGVQIIEGDSGSRRLPAADREFDAVSASAVLEHVGGPTAQVDFLRECGRVGNALFITTPNRQHWLEFHTKLPLLHWLPRQLHRNLLKGLGQPFWADEANLHLLDRGELLAAAREALGDSWQLRVDQIWALGMPSNLLLFAHRRV